jgi:hypothetical protein
MNPPLALMASTNPVTSNLIPMSGSLLAEDLEIYSYPEAIKQLKNYGYISLEDIQKLSHTDLNDVFEEIKCWCIYGNHDPKKLRASLNMFNP